MKEKSTLCIFTKNIYVQTRIGILNHEKQSPQRVCVSVELYTNPISYLKKISEKTIIDYDRIYEAVQNWKDNSHTHLIEMFLQELLAVAFNYKQVDAARISIGKPDIYENADNVGVEAFITRADFKKMRIKLPKKKLEPRMKVRKPPAV